MAIVAIDLAFLAGVTALLGDSLDQRQVVLLVLLLSAVLYGPLRHRLWMAVRRLLLGDRDNPYDAVAGLASTLETTDEGPGQLAAVARAVASAFRVPFVRVEVDRGGGERLIATYGEPVGETRSLPITYRDAVVGQLVLPARGLRGRLSRRDEQLLGDLVRQAATAARTSRLADELQESRERLVVAREEERRRIRRDLHDGLGPALSGVVFRLESAKLLVERDPAAAVAHIEATSDHVQDVVADVRRLVHDLRPPALDDRGLVGALQQHAEGLSSNGLVVRVEADDLGPLTAAVEVAAYRIAGESLTNVARHAAAHTCVVRLTDDRRRAGRRGRRRRHRHRRGRAGRRRPGVAAGTRRRARRTQRGHLSSRRRHRRPGLATDGEKRMSEPVRVVVADDHQIVRDGLVALLGALDGIEVVGTAADGRDAVHVVGETLPDVVVMDIQMPHLDGIEATRFITRAHPDVRVVMLTMNEDDETVMSAIRAGASGYLLKGSGAVRGAARDRGRGRGRHGVRGVAGRPGRVLPVRRRSGAGRGAVPRAHRPGAVGARPAGRGAVERRHRPVDLRVEQDRPQHRVVDLHQAAHRRPGRGDHQGPRGRAGPLRLIARFCAYRLTIDRCQTTLDG